MNCSTKMCGGKSWIFLTFLVLLSLMGDKTITRTQSFALSVPNSDFSYLSSILLNRFKRQEEDDYESSGEGMYLKCFRTRLSKQAQSYQL